MLAEQYMKALATMGESGIGWIDGKLVRGGLVFLKCQLHLLYMLVHINSTGNCRYLKVRQYAAF